MYQKTKQKTYTLYTLQVVYVKQKIQSCIAYFSDPDFIYLAQHTRTKLFKMFWKFASYSVIQNIIP